MSTSLIKYSSLLHNTKRLVCWNKTSTSVAVHQEFVQILPLFLFLALKSTCKYMKSTWHTVTEQSALEDGLFSVFRITPSYFGDIPVTCQPKWHFSPFTESECPVPESSEAPKLKQEEEDSQLKSQGKGREALHCRNLADFFYLLSFSSSVTTSESTDCGVMGPDGTVNNKSLGCSAVTLVVLLTRYGTQVPNPVPQSGCK